MHCFTYIEDGRKIKPTDTKSKLLYITNINFVKSLYLLRFFLALVYVVFSWCQQQAVQSVKIVLTLEIPAFPVSILLPVHCLTLFQSALQVSICNLFHILSKV